MSEEIIEKPENTGEIQETIARNQGGQFLPGVSGNSAGKPKGTKHFNTIFNEILKENIELKQKNGVIIKMPLGKAMAQAMARKALAGNVQAFEAVADRMDGKPAQSMEVEITTPPSPIYGGKSRNKKV